MSKFKDEGFQVRININGITCYFGLYHTENEAANVHDIAAIKLLENPKLNFYISEKGKEEIRNTKYSDKLETFIAKARERSNKLFY